MASERDVLKDWGAANAVDDAAVIAMAIVKRLNFIVFSIVEFFKPELNDNITL
jgi:hypothetical protein